MIKRNALGRGLGALIDGVEKEVLEKKVEANHDISVDSIDSNPFQPRTSFDEQALEELAASIRKLGIVHGEVISVRSRRGKVAVKANVTDQVPEGLVWMAFHFREGCANWLTNPAYDPITQTAEYKACAVQIEKMK